MSFHHCKTIHGSGPNTAGEPRRAITIHLQPGDNRYIRHSHFYDDNNRHQVEGYQRPGRFSWSDAEVEVRVDLDRTGRRSQTMAPGIDAHTGPARTLVGWARVARYEPVEEPPVPHYAAENAFLDSLHVGDVVLATAGGTRAAF